MFYSWCHLLRIADRIQSQKINTHNKATSSKKTKNLNPPFVSNRRLRVFVNMLYSNAACDLSCYRWNMLDGTSHNRDEEPSGIQVFACLLQTLLKKKKKAPENLKKCSHPQQMPFTFKCKQSKRQISINKT